MFWNVFHFNYTRIITFKLEHPKSISWYLQIQTSIKISIETAAQKYDNNKPQSRNLYIFVTSYR